MLLGTLGASLLGNILAGKGINKAGEGVHFSMVMIVIMRMRIIIKIMNSSSCLRVLPIIATK